jgi:hypothetical protein
MKKEGIVMKKTKALTEVKVTDETPQAPIEILD